MSFFLPRNLTPQGWLTDMLLAQVRDPKYKNIKEMLYGIEDMPDETRSYLYGHGRLLYLNPNKKNNIESRMAKPFKAKSKLAAVADFAGKHIGSVYDPKYLYVNFLMNITPAQQAALVPYIRFFIRTATAAKKGTTSVGLKGRPYHERDIVFKEFVDEKFILENKFARVGSAGVVSLTNVRQFPALGLADSFFLDADFYFSSMKTFTEGHIDDLVLGTNRGDYTKLITPLGTKTKCVGGKTIDVGQEQLFVEYGWRFAPGTPDELVPRDIRYMFEREEKKVFGLTWTKHSFNFTENGEISLKVSYTGLPEKKMTTSEDAANVLDIKNSLKLTGYKEENAVLQEKIERLKILKEKQERFDNLLNGCAQSSGKSGLGSWQTFFGQEEPVDKAAKKEQKEVIAELKKEHRTALININKEISAIKEIVAEQMLTAMLIRFADVGQLFRASLTSGRDEDLNFKMRVGIKPVMTTKKAKQQFPEFLDSEKADEDVIKENEKWIKSREDKQKNLFMPSMDDDKRTQFIEQNFNLNSMHLNFETLIATDSEEAKFFRKLLEKAHKDTTNRDRIAAILCALTNCGHSARVEDAGQGHQKKTYGNFFFFPLRALMAWVFDIATEEQRKKLPGICVGNVVARAMGKEFWVNAGDILIEVSVFQKWYYRNVISTRRTKWTLADFMSSIFEDLVPRVLTGHSTDNYANTNFGDITHRSLSLPESWTKASFTVEKSLFFANNSAFDLLYIDETPKNKQFIEGIEDRFVKDAKEVKKEQAEDLIFYTQYPNPSMVNTEAINRLFAGNNTGTSAGLGNRTFSKVHDHADGLYHLTIGEDRGILRTINFSYADNEDLRTGLHFDQHVDSAVKYLRQPYQGAAKLMGTNLYEKGTHFVVSHNPLGIDAADDPGIRGYYWVQSITDNITMGSYTTDISGYNQTPAWMLAAKRKAATENPVKTAKKKTAKFGTFVDNDPAKYIIKDLSKNRKFMVNYFGPKGFKIVAKKEAEKDKKKAKEAKDAKKKAEGKKESNKKCPKGQVFDTSSKFVGGQRCRPVCHGGKFWYSTTGKCECPKNTVDKGNKCAPIAKSTKAKVKQKITKLDKKTKQYKKKKQIEDIK